MNIRMRLNARILIGMSVALFGSIIFIYIVYPTVLSKIIRTVQNPPSEKTENISTVTKLKIITKGEGIYRVKANELTSITPQLKDINPAGFHLTARGQEVPLDIQLRDNSYDLVFYATRSESLYTDENVYILSWEGDGRQMGIREMLELPVVGSDIEQVFEKFKSFDEDHIYLPQVVEGDHWLWTSIPAPKTVELKVELTDVDVGPAILRIAMWGNTQADVSPDHHIVVSVNGYPLGEDSWDGRGWHQSVFNALSMALQDGLNSILVQSPGDTGSPADIVYVDKIDLSYPARLIAEDGQLVFTSDGGLQSLSGFKGVPVLYDITNSLNPLRIDIQYNAQDQESLFLGEAGHSYIVVDERGYLKPSDIEIVANSPNLRSPVIEANYLAIGPEDLLVPLQPLLEWRRNQGLAVEALPVQTIYDQFGDGYAEPNAIQTFLRYAAQTWSKPPDYVLLVGDSTYDPKGFVYSTGSYRLPTYYVQTQYGGQTASDTPFALVDEDALPDLAIGRIPAQNAGQVRDLVEKILDYEKQAPTGTWRKQVLAIADGQDGIFRQDAQVFLDRFPSNYLGNLYDPQPGVVDAIEQISNYYQNGIWLVAYFGHGSIDMWGKDRLLTAKEVSSLPESTNLPVVVNITCLTGLFIHPEITSLAEVLLFEPKSGAISVLAPTSLTLPADQSFLTRVLVSAILDQTLTTWGKIYLSAVRQIPMDFPGTREVGETFLFFGDPALQVIR
jgi:hypothetical protein